MCDLAQIEELPYMGVGMKLADRDVLKPLGIEGYDRWVCSSEAPAFVCRDCGERFCPHHHKHHMCPSLAVGA